MCSRCNSRGAAYSDVPTPLPLITNEGWAHHGPIPAPGVALAERANFSIGEIETAVVVSGALDKIVIKIEGQRIS